MQAVRIKRSTYIDSSAIAFAHPGASEQESKATKVSQSPQQCHHRHQDERASDANIHRGPVAGRFLNWGQDCCQECQGDRLEV